MRSTPDIPASGLGADAVPEMGLRLFHSVAQGDGAAESELYQLVGSVLSARAGRPYADIEDDHHDCYLAILLAIRHSLIEEPKGLLKFIHVVVRRRFATRVQRLARERERREQFPEGLISSTNLEGQFEKRERRTLVLRGMDLLPVKDRDLVAGYYLNGETRENIMQFMDLDESAYRLRKSRAKQRLVGIVQALIEPPRNT